MSKVVEGIKGEKYVFQFLGTSSQNVLFWGCHIFSLPSGYPINSIFQWHYIFTTQQTFTLMKTPWRRLSSLEDVLIKTNIFSLVIRLQKTSLSRPIYSSWPYVFKTSSASRRLAKTSSRHLQDVFKTYHQANCLHRSPFWETYGVENLQVC